MPDPRRKECACPLAKHRHGTAACRTRCGCRCLACRVAYAEQIRNRRAHGPAPRRAGPSSRVGTARRIQALHAIGWSGAHLAERLGITYQAIHDLRTKDRPIYPRTAARVAALYNELWDRTPTGPGVRKTLRWATRNGWVPPMAWDDDDLDDPAAVPFRPSGPEPRDLKPCGTRAAVRRHYRRGEPLDAACAAESRRDSAERKAAAA